MDTSKILSYVQHGLLSAFAFDEDAFLQDEQSEEVDENRSIKHINVPICRMKGLSVVRRGH